MGRTLAPMKFNQRKREKIEKKRREKQNRRKERERRKWCISCALRGGVQRGPIKGLDAAAQMRYTPQNRSPCFSNRSPCFSLLTTQHTQNHSKLIIVSDKWLESPTRASVRVAVLLSLSVQSCNIHPVYPRQRSRLWDPVKYASSITEETLQVC